MKEFFFWWLAIEAVGLAALPLTFVFFRRLPDGGFAFSKVVGLLLLGYGVWAGATVGVLPNRRASVILLLVIIAALSAAVAAAQRRELVARLRSGWRYMAFVEAFFFAALAVAVFVRSFAPEIMWGEKPFELAFLNSIHRAESFPPADPWLSGHSISYYYFGYVMVSALTKLVALETSATFYLSLSLMASLAAVSALGLVYNLIAASRVRSAEEGPPFLRRALVAGLAAAFLMLIVSNLAGVFELMARHGVGSRGFYGLVGIFGLDGPYNCHAAPADCGAWYPTRYWWWWWATRMGSQLDIQEFPFFSLQFGDLHAHVMVMPFLITLFAAAFQMVLAAPRDGDAGPASRGWWSVPGAYLLGLPLFGGMLFAAARANGASLPFAALVAALAGSLQAMAGGLARRAPADPGRPDGLWWLRHPGRFILLSLLVGGIAFTDVWAIPLTVLMLVAGIVAASWLRAGGPRPETLVDSAGFAIPLLGAAAFFYLPFYLHFDAETNGLGITQTVRTFVEPPPNSEATRPLHFLLFWSPLLWVVLSFVALHAYQRWREIVRPLALLAAVLAWAAPVGLYAVIVLGREGPSGLWDELAERGASLITVAMLAAAISVVALSFLRELTRPEEGQDRGQLFAFLLAGFALMMLLGAELYYVRDILGWRANTVFRFWHESWIVLSLVGGFAVHRLTLAWSPPRLRLPRNPWPVLAMAGVTLGGAYSIFVALDPWNELYARWWTATAGLWLAGGCVLAYAVAAALRGVNRPAAVRRLAWLAVSAVLLGAALVYPVTVVFERTDGFRHPQSLNGLVHIEQGDPFEYRAARWLNEHVDGTPVVLEAVGGDFTGYARVSSRTGLPTVMGWVGHEIQWRGYPDNIDGSEPPFSDRSDDVAKIYTTEDMAEAERLLKRYKVEYVYVGRLERQRYGEDGLAKFGEFMLPVYENEGVTIYRMPEDGEGIAPPASRARS